MRVLFIGDIVGRPGRTIVQQAVPRLIVRQQLDLVIANAENAAGGSGLTPAIYRELIAAGVDGITLGDHVFRDQRIAAILDDPSEPIARPANLPAVAAGRGHLRLVRPGERDVVVITVLGRVFVNLPADDPFAAADRVLAELGDPAPIVIVEAHMEATSEKAALAHHLDGRVAAVLGTHTHVPTADARVLPGGTAFQSDVGMCGPWDSCIGRDKHAVVRHMTTAMYVPFDVGEGDERMCGAVVTIDERRGLASAIEPVQYRADRGAPPFTRSLG